MPHYTTVGGYPNTDPYYISPEEESAMEERDRPAPHTRWLNQECGRCGKTRREHIWTSICPVGSPDEPTQWFAEQSCP